MEAAESSLRLVQVEAVVGAATAERAVARAGRWAMAAYLEAVGWEVA